MRCSWGLIGRVSATVGGDEITLPKGRPSDVLVLLALNRGQTMSIERLVDELWPDTPPKTARNSLQRFVSDARAALGPARDTLVTETGGYRLDTVADERDVDAHLGAAETARSAATPVEVVRALAEIVDALGPELAPGFDHLDAVRDARLQVKSARLAIIDEAAELALTHRIGLVDELQRWFAADPLNERVGGFLMTALARAGRQVEALAMFQELRDRLLNELGVSPSPALEAVELDILQQREAIDFEAPEPASALSSPPNNNLIGRSELLAQMADLVDRSRLVTLAGPGGAGKTSLAEAYLRSIAATGAETHAVPLADLRTGGLMLERIASELGLVSETQGLEGLRDQVARRAAATEGVLLLDNAEHLVGDVADIVHSILKREGPGRVIVTSRELLALPEESVLAVDPLPVPDGDGPAPESPAVRLFATRGAAASAHSYEELLHAPESVTICRAVDGLPLGIELAAVRLKVVSPAELAQRMDHPVRAAGSLRTNDRQRSLESLLDWSWQLLDGDEQRLLIRLAVFNGWPLAAIDHLDPDAGFDLLTGLVAKSLVQAQRSDRDGTRYLLLETIRDYVLGRSTPEEVDDARAAHAEWVLTLCRRYSLAEASALAEVFDLIGPETSNLLSALDWYEEHGCTRDLAELAGRGAGLFAHRGPTFEGAQRVSRAVSLVRGPCPKHDVDHDELIDRDRLGYVLNAEAATSLVSGDTAAAFRGRIDAAELIEDEPFDWAIDAGSNLGVGFTMVQPNGDGLRVLDSLAPLAPRTPSAELNVAMLAAMRGQVLAMERRYEEAIDEYRRVLRYRRPGRIPLLGEVGMLTSLHLLGRHEEAAAFAARTESRPDTDHWHFEIDIARAIAIGATDHAAGATILQSIIDGEQSEFPGVNNEVRIATGALAWHAGDHERCKAMLDGVMPRLPATANILMEYKEAEPGAEMSAEQWAKYWRHGLAEGYNAQQAAAEGWVKTEMDLARVNESLRRFKQELHLT